MKATSKFLCLCMVFTVLTYGLLYGRTSNIPKNATFWSDYPNEELADFIVDNMTNEELLAQIIMFGWKGAGPSRLEMDWVEKRAIGSMKVYGWATNDEIEVARSVIKVQKAAKKTRFQIPLYISTDQEGGWIRHVKGNTSDTPGNLAIGASGLAMDAYYTGYYIAMELRALGVNMNFAPTVDIYSNLKSTVIGTRSFGSDPEKTAVLSASYASGMRKAGVIPTAKHFPGHGDTSLDSHGKLPEIQIDLETLEKRELLPFKYLIENDIPAIMSGHLSFPKITGDSVPATLSKYFLQDILRGELKYEGLIITDDMMMNGATLYAGSVSKAFTQAIEAGNDIVISSTTAGLNENLWVNNCNLMESDRDFRNKVKKAARRVILSKLNYFKGENFVPIYPELDKIGQRVPDPEGVKFFTSQACRSLTAYNHAPENYVIKETDGTKIFITSQYENFINEGLKRYPKAPHFYFDFDMGPNRIEWTADQILSKSAGCSVIILGVGNDCGFEVAKAIDRLSSNGVKVIIVSMQVPTYYMEGKDRWKSDILMCYSYSPYTFKAVYSALAGEFQPHGILPLKNEN